MHYVKLLKAEEELKLVLMHYKDFDEKENENNAVFLLAKGDMPLRNGEFKTRIDGNESDSELIEKASKYFGNLPKDIKVEKMDITININR